MWPFKSRRTWGNGAYSYPKTAKHGYRFKGKYGWRQFDKRYGWLPYRTCMKCDELMVGFTRSMFELCPACQWGPLIKSQLKTKGGDEMKKGSFLDQVENVLTDRKIVDVDFYGVDLDEMVCDGVRLETHDGYVIEFSVVEDNIDITIIPSE